jgi:hypothetical protein
MPTAHKEKKISNRKAPPSSFQPATQPKASAIESISSSLVQELEESIAKIEDHSGKMKKNQKFIGKRAPSRSNPLQIDQLDFKEEASESNDYVDILVRQLHVSLNLPDFGEVKIELTLRQDGTVAKLKVLNAESQQNRKYLEAKLPQLKFPQLSGFKPEEKEHTFVLNFCNET